jgi:hypothetical protein
MRPRVVLALAALATVGVLAATPAAQAEAPPTGGIEVTVDQTRLTAVIGDRVTIRAQVTNPGTARTDPLIAHLNVASLTGTYVDLEDWTASPTLQVAALDARSTTPLSWDIQAVNAGTFDAYVVLLPNGATSAGVGPLVASAPVHITVAGRRTLNAGGSLPVAIAIPLLLGFAAATVRYRRRRS